MTFHRNSLKQNEELSISSDLSMAYRFCDKPYLSSSNIDNRCTE